MGSTNFMIFLSAYYTNLLNTPNHNFPQIEKELEYAFNAVTIDIGIVHSKVQQNQAYLQ